MFNFIWMLIRLNIDFIVGEVFELRNVLKKNPPIFLGLLAYFIVVLAFPLAIGSYIFNEANAMFSKKSIDAAHFVLQQSAVTFDRFLEASDDAAYSFAVDPSIQNAANLNRPAFASKDIVYFTSLLNRIQSNDISSPFENRTILFLKRPGAVMLRESISFGIEQYYNNYLSYSGLPYKDWETSILNQQLNRHFMPSTRILTTETRNADLAREYISYVHSFPLMTSVVLIDSISARRILSETIISDYGAALAADFQWNIILSAGNQSVLEEVDLSSLASGATSLYQFIGDTQMIVLSRESSASGLRYISINPVNEALKDAVHLRQITIGGVFCILAVGFLISLLLSRRYTKPMQEVVGLLGKRFTGKESVGNYKMIKERVSDLISSHNELSKKLQEQMITSRALFLGQLLGGTIRDQQELEHFLEYFSLNLKGGSYAVLYMACRLSEENNGMELSDILEQDIFKLAVDEILQSSSLLGGYAYPLENKDIAVILCSSRDDPEDSKRQIRSFIGEISKRLQDGCNIAPRIGVGMAYRRLLDVNFSFVEARIAVECLLQNTSQSMALWYDTLDSQAKCGYFYPMDMEQKLIALAKAGKQDELLRSLHQIYKENFTHRTLMRNIQIQLFYEMRSTLMRIVNEFKHDVNIDSLLRMDFSATPEYSALQSFTKAYIAICETVNSKKKSHSQQLIERILERINSSYADPNMSVELLASAFDITPTYFSRFFKEQTAQAFSSYLENLRMKKACELLENTSQSIDSIAAIVGYNSAYSFRRAFKKNLGVVPSEYRK
ncbi:MAG: AraC family transcriptional regulator [Clostridiales bacterium]|nr:AraC family transcriptional regulator [Clostridiales bacterium]